MKRLCLVVGDAPEKWDDVQAFWDLHPAPHDVCCINRAGLLFPCDFRYWVSFHSDELYEWAKIRPGAELWSTREFKGVNISQTRFSHGSSAMVAAQFCLDTWGYEKIVLAGVPLSGLYEGYFPAWSVVANEHEGRIRAMNGNTKNLFGLPSRDFVRGYRD